MSDKNKNNSAAVAVAELTTAYNNAVAVKEALTEASTPEEVATAENVVETTKKALDAAVELEAKAKSSGAKEINLKIKFLLSPTGKFNLAYNVDESASLPEAQARELVEAKYAEFVK